MNRFNEEAAVSVIFSGRGVLSVFLTGLCVASSTMSVIPPSYASEEGEQVVCGADSAQAGIYTPRADRAHPSKGDASGHGWWESSNAECGMEKRWVKNHLWAKWGGIWWKVGDSGWEKHGGNGGPASDQQFMFHAKATPRRPGPIRLRCGWGPTLLVIRSSPNGLR